MLNSLDNFTTLPSLVDASSLAKIISYGKVVLFKIVLLLTVVVYRYLSTYGVHPKIPPSISFSCMYQKLFIYCRNITNS